MINLLCNFFLQFKESRDTTQNPLTKIKLLAEMITLTERVLAKIFMENFHREGWGNFLPTIFSVFILCYSTSLNILPPFGKLLKLSRMGQLAIDILFPKLVGTMKNTTVLNLIEPRFISLLSVFIYWACKEPLPKMWEPSKHASQIVACQLSN